MLTNTGLIDWVLCRASAAVWLAPIEQTADVGGADAWLLQWSWFSIGRERTKPSAHFVQILMRLEELMPEALPRRYGLYEPPKEKVRDSGFDAFSEWAFANLTEGIVIYPDRPFDEFSLDRDGSTA